MTCLPDTFLRHSQCPAWSSLRSSRYSVSSQEWRRHGAADHHLSSDSTHVATWVFGRKVQRFQCCIKRRTFKVLFLPAETFQSRRCDLGHVKVLVDVFFFKQDDLDDNDVYGIADSRIFVQRRNHIHYRQQICLDIAAFMKLHHRRISNNKSFNVSCSDNWSRDTLLVTMSLLAISFPMIPYFTATLNDNL